MGSMHTGLEELPDGMERLAAFYGERAEAGVGADRHRRLRAERGGRLNAHPMMMTSGADADRHQVVTRAVHDAGGRIALQILHTGRYGYHSQVGRAVGAQVADQPRDAARARPPPSIERTIEDFARCAVLAREAGYDGVEIMGSEGYLITEFLSPRTNHRSDDWGGALENRLRLPARLCGGCAQRLGDEFLIMFRISVLDLVEGG